MKVRNLSNNRNSVSHGGRHQRDGFQQKSELCVAWWASPTWRASTKVGTLCRLVGASSVTDIKKSRNFVSPGGRSHRDKLEQKSELCVIVSCFVLSKRYVVAAWRRNDPTINSEGLWNKGSAHSVLPQSMLQAQTTKDNARRRAKRIATWWAMATWRASTSINTSNNMSARESLNQRISVCIFHPTRHKVPDPYWIYAWV